MGDSRPPLGERARLVKDNHPHFRGALQCVCALHSSNALPEGQFARTCMLSQRTHRILYRQALKEGQGARDAFLLNKRPLAVLLPLLLPHCLAGAAQNTGRRCFFQ